MKKFLLTSAAVLGFVGTAAAADLPARMPAKVAPMVAPIFSWTGCYIGGFVGGAVANRSVNATDPQSTGGTFAPGTFYNAPNANAANGGAFGYDVGNSVTGGGTAGCNYQLTASPFVVGVEGEVGYMKLSGSAVDPYSIGPTSYGGDTSAFTRIGNWYGVAAGRLGYAWDRVLFYGKAGVGFTDVNSSVTDFCTTGACGRGTLGAGYSDTQAFWVGGGGIEWAFDPNWSVKAEYLFLGINKSYSVCGAGGGTATGSNYCSSHSNDGVHTAKVGLNYRFNWGGPVVARY
jgi:outer membrane immunogenic protein